MERKKAATSYMVRHVVTSNDRIVWEGEMMDYDWQPIVEDIEKRGASATVIRGKGRRERTIYRTEGGE